MKVTYPKHNNTLNEAWMGKKMGAFGSYEEKKKPPCCTVRGRVEDRFSGQKAAPKHGFEGNVTRNYIRLQEKLLLDV